MTRWWVLFWFVSGCSCNGDTSPCRSSAECDGGVCVAGRCEPSEARDAGATSDALSCATPCGEDCCAGGQRCVATACVLDLGPCDDNDDCRGDSFCDEEQRCTPYGMPPERTFDEGCVRPIEIGAFAPAEQCAWTGEGAPAPEFDQVYSTPLVADFDLDGDPSVLAPSIVFASFPDGVEPGGVLRFVDGRTCETLVSLTDPADRLVYASQQAIGDLDADGSRPEVVGAALIPDAMGGGLVAFGYDEAAGTFRRRWYSRRCDEEGEPRHLVNDYRNNNGPSMHDLDDDGIPEVLFGRFVYDASGCVLNPAQPYDGYLDLGLFSVATDVDGDGAAELVYHDGVYAWDGSDWQPEAYWRPVDPEEAERIGHVAVGDFGDFGDTEPGDAEIVVASAGPPSTVRVMTPSGRIVFGPFPHPNGTGRGGPPTVGDFDGDGRAEFAVAGGDRYTVFDLDCDADAPAAGCDRVAGLPRGVLWTQPSQDASSNVTGSSVFDFDADGSAEVVYADECFVRIYRGADGEVLFSRSASSGTGYQYPVVADVDGDFNSEIVVAMTRSVSCPERDPIFAGESLFRSETGIVVLRDERDRWAASRPIWNQHAYHVTHVADDGRIPRTSEWMANHEGPNTFRMNAQGALAEQGAADLTVALADDVCGATGETELGARVCNRGTNPVPDGARVVFYEGDPDAGAGVACETLLPRLLGVGECTRVSCAYTLPDGDAPDITVVVDPEGEVFECRSGNNRGVIPSVFCGLI